MTHQSQEPSTSAAPAATDQGESPQTPPRFRRSGEDIFRPFTPRLSTLALEDRTRGRLQAS